ncbi:MAG TPA: phosphatidylinositol-specific phospholipase C domain-containing protein [Cellvibrio sp.]|nr:phosphatidylinositol-specific phospholipase C domain-containing protein [Cellvibrio sp.]
MSYGCLVSVVNLAKYDVQISVSLVDDNNWEKSLSPRQLNGATVEGNSSKEVHVEVVNGQASAKFNVTFTIPNVGTVETTVDALDVINGGKRQGYLCAGGTAVDKYWVIEAQYDKQSWDNNGYGWRHLSVIILPKVDPRNWMARLPDDYTINQLTVPGSHDTGTAAITGRADNSVARARICQGLSISQQLNIGIRFLDIRVNKSRNFEIMHEGTPTATWFWDDCLIPVMTFLNENPNETVLLCVKDEHGSTNEFHDDILQMLAAAPYQYIKSRVCTSHVPPKLGDLRGKLVLLRRYWIDPDHNKHKVDDADSGFGLTDFKDANGGLYAWPDNSDTFAEVGDGNVVLQQPGNTPCVIQDWYNLGTRMQASKVGLIIKYLDAAKNSLPHAWFINFASCTALGHVWDDPRSFAVGEDGINAALITYLVTRGIGRYGIVPMDFVGNAPEEVLINLLINSNPLQ